MRQIVADWLGDFVEWLRNAVGAEPPSKVLEHYSAQEGLCTLSLLFDERSVSPVPGVVQLWLCSHNTAHFDLLLILVNIAQVREVQGKEQPSRGALPRNWHREFELRTRVALQQQGHIAASHLFLVGWVSKQPIAARFVESKLRYFRRIECTAVHAVDLQGHTAAWMGSNDHASKIGRAIARRCLHAAARPPNTWEMLMRALDGGYSRTWLDWLNEFASEREQTRISKGHILQPPRSRVSLQVPRDEV